MNSHSLTRPTGVLFILGAILVNIPYALLIANFNYPDILRQPTGEILTAFVQGGENLILTWLAFAWSGLPILLAILLLPRTLGRENDPLLKTATTLGTIGAIAQVVGLLRWVFIVPGLANSYAAPAASATTRESIALIFQAVHQFGGVMLGEHIGQTFTILWMVLISVVILRSRLFASWTGWLGLAASGVYLMAQGELLGTVIPEFPQIGPAGLVGSLLWLAWMIVLGIFLLLIREAKSRPATV